MGGEGEGTNPEQLFAMGYAACFEGAIGVIGRRERRRWGTCRSTAASRSCPTDGRAFSLAVELPRVAARGRTTPEVAARIVAGAHLVCPYSNATRGNIDVTLTANGRALD